MIEWDPWCVPDDYECEVIENDAPVPKHVPLHHPVLCQRSYSRRWRRLLLPQRKMRQLLKE
ncbi:hypothetical protein MKW92_000772 [Papaver armeniacum]|nr:hypothetical protein MKW92_000772 [Papaver armeniacum]